MYSIVFKLQYSGRNPVKKISVMGHNYNMPGKSSSASSKTSFWSISRWLVGSSSAPALAPLSIILIKGKSGFFSPPDSEPTFRKNVFISEKKSAQERAHLCIGVESVGLLELFKHCVCRIEVSAPDRNMQTPHYIRF